MLQLPAREDNSRMYMLPGSGLLCCGTTLCNLVPGGQQKSMNEHVDQTNPIGVLLMEYGEPAHLDEVEPYLRAHAGGHTPPADMVAMLREQFVRVWGDTPPVSMPPQIETALAAELYRRYPARYQVTLGARYWTPSITTQVVELVGGGARHVIAVPLSAHMSLVALRDYTRTLDKAGAQCVQPFHITLVEQWHDLPGLLDTLAAHASTALEQFAADERDQVVALFCAHSVPESERKQEDDYQRQLTATATTVAERVGLRTWHLAFHSAQGPGQWLGPDIIAVLDTLYSEGVRHVLYVPIGTVYDNVELLYDFDVKAVERATELGISVCRAALPNIAPHFISGLADLVERYTDPIIQQ